MENLVLVVLKQNEDAFNLFYKLKEHFYEYNAYSIIQGAVFTKTNGKFDYKDGFNQNRYEEKGRGLSYLEGGLLGGMAGALLARRFGMMLGTAAGLSAAAYSQQRAEDTYEGYDANLPEFDPALDTLNFYKVFNDQIAEGEYGVVLHVEETNTAALDKVFNAFPVKEVRREDANKAYHPVAAANLKQNAPEPENPEGFWAKVKQHAAEMKESVQQKLGHLGAGQQ